VTHYLNISARVTSREARPISVQRLIGALFCIFSLMPWVSFGTNNLDSQPWSVLLAILFIAFCAPKIKMPLYSFAIIFLLALGLLFSLFATLKINPETVLRATVSYLSVPLIFVAFYHYLRRYGFPWRIFITVNIIWILMGFVELYFPGFTEILTKQRTTADRGVTSLAPEPTFFAIYLFFSSWMLLEAVNFKINRPVLAMFGANLGAVFFLAQSTMVVLFCVIAGAAFLWYRFLPFRISRRTASWVGLFLVAIIGGAAVGWQSFEDSRIMKIGTFFFSNFSVVEVLLLDASVSQRVEAVAVSFLGAFHHWFFPAGLDTFLVTRDSLDYDFSYLFWWPTESTKIMSWVGALFYELGVFGIAALALLVLSAYQRTRRSRVSLILLFVILLSAVPLAFPLVPMLLALFAAKKRMPAFEQECAIP